MDVIEFIYNAEGTRTEKKVNGVSIYYQYDTGGNIVLETDSNKSIKVKYIRDASGKALAQEQNNNTYYYLYNAHGDVTALTDSSGNVVATYTYDEFGNLKASTGSIYNPLRYSGTNNSYYDEEIGLYKMGVRYYDSSTGRWLTRDQAVYDLEEPQTHQEYVYAKGNPTSYNDPSGFNYRPKVYAMADNSWENAWPKTWKKKLKDRIEIADNDFAQFNIDFQIKVYGYYKSSKGVGIEKARNEAIRAWNKNRRGTRMLATFRKKPVSDSGVGMADNIPGRAFIVIWSGNWYPPGPGRFADAMVARHEAGHVYGAYHHNAKCVMNPWAQNQVKYRYFKHKHCRDAIKKNAGRLG